MLRKISNKKIFFSSIIIFLLLANYNSSEAFQDESVSEYYLSLYDLVVDTTATEIILSFNLDQPDSLETPGMVTASLITIVENDTFSVSQNVILTKTVNPVFLKLKRPDFLGDLVYQRFLIKFQNERISKEWLEPLWNKLLPLQLKLLSQASYLPGTNAHFELQVVKKDCVLCYPDIPVNLTILFSEADSAIAVGKTNDYGIFVAEFPIPDSQAAPFNIKAQAQLRTGWTKLNKEISIKKSENYTARTFLTTDKNLYQPGQIIHIRTMTLSQFKNKPLADFKIPLKINDPFRNCIFFEELRTNEFGIAATDFQLADVLNLGTYEIYVANEKRKTIEVNEYSLPSFNLTLKLDKQFYLTTDEIKGDLQAKYFFGKPVALAQVTLTFYSGRGRESLYGTTDENGRFEFSYKLLDSTNGDTIYVNAAVVDKANHSEYIRTTTTVWKTAISMKIVPEFGNVISDFQNNFYIITSAGDGQPISTKVKISAGAQSQTIKTNKNGFGKFQLTIPSLNDDSFIFVVSVRDDYGNRNEKLCLVNPVTPEINDTPLNLTPGNSIQETRDRELSKRKIDASQLDEQELNDYCLFFGTRQLPLMIHTNEDYFCQGETVEILCVSTQEREVVVLDLVQDENWISSAFVPIKNKQGKIAIELEPRFSGLITIKWRPETFSNDSNSVVKYFYVATGNELEIKINPDKPVYLPGTNATLHFAVTDRYTGVNRPAAVSLNVVDPRVVQLFGGIKDNELEFFKFPAPLKSLQHTSPQYSPKKIMHQFDVNTVEGSSFRDHTRLAFADLYHEEDSNFDYLKVETISEDFSKYEENLKIYNFYLEDMAARRIYGAIQEFITQNPNFKPDSIETAQLVAAGYLEKRYSRTYDDSPLFINKIYFNNYINRLDAVIVGFDDEEYNYDDGYDRDYDDHYEKKVEEERRIPEPVLRRPRLKPEMIVDIPLIDDYIYEDNSECYDIEVSSALPAGIMPLPPASYFNLKNGRAYITGIKNKFFQFFTGSIAGRIVLDYRQPATPQPLIEVRLANQKTVTDRYGNFVLENVKPGKYDLIIKGLVDDLKKSKLTIEKSFVFQDTIKSMIIKKGRELNLLIEFPWRLNPTNATISFYENEEIAGFDDIRRLKKLKMKLSSFKHFPPMDIHWDDFIEPVLSWIGSSAKDIRKDINFSTREKPRARQNFPETMYWNPSIITDENGEASIDIRLADSITDWDLYSSAVSKTGHLGTTTSSLRVFQDFFIDLDLPGQLTCNDEISVPVTVFNFLDKDQTIQLELEAAPWFEFTAAANEEIKLNAEEVAVVYFDIRVCQFGTFDLRVNAYGSDQSDAIIKSVKVVPDGTKFTETVNGRFQQQLKKRIFFPAESITGTEEIFVKIFPNTMVDILEGLEGILRMPYGCFEQVASSTYPNIVVLDYLQKSGQCLPEIEAMAKNYLNEGYQKLLSYEVSPAGFEWFGQAPANLFLTAYGLLIFSEMSRVRYVDIEIMARNLTLLLNLQNEDGSWTEKRERRYVDTWTQVMHDPVKETAYVLWAILEASNVLTSGKKILQLSQLDGGVKFLVDRIDSIDDPYTLALCANVFYLYFGKDHLKTRSIYERLLAKKMAHGKEIFWKASGNSIVSSRGLTADLETTALAGYAFARYQGNNDIVNGVYEFLLNNRDDHGGWHSTQATTLAIKMLLTCLERPLETGEKLLVSINGEVGREITITPENRLSLLIFDLHEKTKKGDNEITVSYSGKSLVNYQLIANHYQGFAKHTATNGKIGLVLEMENKDLFVGDTLGCRLKLNNTENNAPGMIVTRVNLPPYFKIIQEDLNQLVAQEKIEKFERKQQQLVFYLKGLAPQQAAILDFRLMAQAPIKAHGFYTDVYEYYQPDNRNDQLPQLVEVIAR